MRTTCGTILAAEGLSLTTNAAGIATDALVTVDVTNAVRAVKPMHAVNNGPTVKKPKGDQKCGNFEDYKAARIPFARTHDSINCVAGGAHTCDISAVFPDLDPAETEPPKNPRCWGGTVTEFFKFYETAAKHLKGKFPNLKIGGPAICGRMDWGERFLAYCRDNSVPLDFFSWHVYATEPRQVTDRADYVRELMDKYGFEKSESILNEWNYVKGWVDEWPYSLEVESGRFNQKGAAFVMATMVDCQSRPVDMLMFYDAMVGSGMNNMFSKPTLQPLKGYYPFYAWSKLVDCGTQVACTVREGRREESDANTGTVFKSENGKPVGSFRRVAAKGEDGSGALIVARYSEDNNVTDTAKVMVSVPGVSLAKARCHLTDSVRTYTEVPLDLQGDGTALIRMQPNSFAVVEW